MSDDPIRYGHRANVQRVLVCGATGNQGGTIARWLWRAGRYRVAALSRDPGSASAVQLKNEGIEVLQADLLSNSSFRDLIFPDDIVFLVTQPWDDSRGVYDRDREIRQAKNVIWQCGQVNIRHLVFCSIVNPANKATGISFVDGKLRIEKIIKGSGLNYTILRSAPYMETLSINAIQKKATGNYPAAANIPYTSLDDIGRLSLLLVGDLLKFQGRTINVVSDICSGWMIENQATVISGAVYNYKAGNRIMQWLKYPNTYRLGKFLANHKDEFFLYHTEFDHLISSNGMVPYSMADFLKQRLLEYAL